MYDECKTSTFQFFCPFCVKLHTIFTKIIKKQLMLLNMISNPMLMAAILTKSAILKQNKILTSRYQDVIRLSHSTNALSFVIVSSFN